MINYDDFPGLRAFHNKRREEFKCVYAGPEFFGIDDSDKEKPTFKWQNPDESEEAIGRVYAGPEYPENKKENDNEPYMDELYAAPEYFGLEAKDESISQEDNKLTQDTAKFEIPPVMPVMQTTYAGPEFYGNGGQPAGVAVDMTNRCFKCGAKYEDGAKFCSDCGNKLVED